MKRRDRNLAVALVLLAVMTLGCTNVIDEARKDWFRTSADDERDAAIAQAEKPATDDVMKSEDVHLEGKWTWPSLTVDYTGGHLKDPRIYPIERVGEGWTFTIVKKGDGYTTTSDGTVTLKGTTVTVTEGFGSGDTITFTGEIKGDTIVGTVHQTVVPKTLSSGVAQGGGEYEGPWTSTRLE